METEQIQRFPARRPVRMTVLFQLEADGQTESLGKAVNISQGGLRFDANRPYDVDSGLRLRFQLPGERKGLRVRGRVRWVNREDRKGAVYAHGVEFLEMSAEQLEALRTYLTRSKPAPQGL